MTEQEDTSVETSDRGKSTAAGALSEFPRGTLLAGRYRVISKCEQGGMGVVYKVEEITAHKELALKVLTGKKFDEVALRKLQREARASWAVAHPNVIAVHDCGLLDDGVTLFLAMDFVEGQTLAQIISSSGPLSIEQAISVFVPVCIGLATAHRRGVVHREVSPSNIMIVKDKELGSQGSVKVANFALSRLMQYEGGEIQAWKQTGQISGSPNYMSPEQCRGKRVDHRSDVYSLGCVLFEALAGTTPFINENPLTTMMQQVSDPAPTLTDASLGRKFPQALEDIVAKMLAKAPDDRYQDLGVVAHELTYMDTNDQARLSEAGSDRIHGRKSESDPHRFPLSPRLMIGTCLVTAVALAAVGYFSYHFIGTSGQSRDSSPEKAGNSPSEHKNAKTTEIEVPVPLSPTMWDFDKRFQSALTRPNQFGLMIFSNCEISAAQMQKLAQVPWVRAAHLIACTIDNRSLSAFEKKQNFARIDLSESNFDDVGADCISRCSAITQLAANECPGISGKGLTKLARMKKLRSLHISQTNASAGGLRALSNMDGLSLLSMMEVRGLSDKMLACLQHSRVRVLELDRNKAIDDGAIKYLLAMPRLEFVSLNQTMVTAKGIEELMQNSKVIVSVADCPRINPEAFWHLQQRFGSDRLKTFHFPDF